MIKNKITVDPEMKDGYCDADGNYYRSGFGLSYRKD